MISLSCQASYFSTNFLIIAAILLVMAALFYTFLHLSWHFT